MVLRSLLVGLTTITYIIDDPLSNAIYLYACASFPDVNKKIG